MDPQFNRVQREWETLQGYRAGKDTPDCTLCGNRSTQCEDECRGFTPLEGEALFMRCMDELRVVRLRRGD